MSSSERSRLEDLAEDLADGIRIDWQQERRQCGDDLQSLQGLELLDAVRRTFDATDAVAAVGAATDPDHNEPVLFRWGPLDVLEKLDEGSYGEVYRAIDRPLLRPVALKLRKPSGDDEDTDWLAEGRRLARLRHANVLAVHGAAEHDGRIGLWTELLTGGNLRDQLTEGGPLDFDELVGVGRAVADALAAIHDAGMIHGDVKASNVFREESGNVVLLDFGSGRELTEAASSWGSQGSPLTTAPEVLEGHPARPTADIYSLGAMLYLLASGYPPIEAEHYDELVRRAKAGAVPNLAHRRPDLPRAFVAIVHRALAVEPSRRYPDGGAFREALQACVSDEALRTVGPAPSRTGFGRSIAAVAMLFFAAAILTAAWWLLSPRFSGPTLSIRAQMTRLGETEVVVENGATVRPGDRLNLRVRVEQPTYLYLLNEDEQGRSYVLFPLPGAELQNPVPAGAHRLPGVIGSDLQAWVVTSTGGSESFLLAASNEPLPTVESYMERTRKAGAIDSAPRSGETSSSKTSGQPPVGSEDSWEAVRGVGGLAPADSPRGTGLEGLRAAIAESDTEIWMEWIRLDNPL